MVLLVVIPLMIFINTRTITSSFEKNIDSITQSKAVLAEDIIRFFITEDLADTALLQKSIADLLAEHSDIVAISVLQRGTQDGMFQVVASNDQEEVGKEIAEIQNTLAWNQPEGIAFLESNESGRLWTVTKALRNGTEDTVGLLSMSFSLRGSDALINATLNRSYLILLGTIIVILFLVANQARLFQYVFLVDQLREVDKMKDTFVSMASHELRSPLTAIKGNIEFLQEKQQKESADEESRHYVENIASSVNRLSTLVGDMLEVSRLEGNRIPIEIQTVNPDPIIAQSIEEMLAQAVQKGLQLEYTPGTRGAVATDPERLKQILVNLIGNALKYTEKGSVRVTTALRQKEYLIVVADTGIGISAEDQQRLFQKFSRIQNDKTRNIVGTGLGLWITLELARRMKGVITVESIEGVGSHFTLHLPLQEESSGS